MASRQSEKLGEAVATRRAHLGLSQQALSDRSDIAKPTINAIENAKRDAYRPMTLHRLGRALGWANGELARLLVDPDFELPEPSNVMNIGDGGRLVAVDPERGAVGRDWPDNTDDPGPDDDPATPAAQRPPLELAALSGKLEQLSEDDRELIESMIDRMLEGD